MERQKQNSCSNLQIEDTGPYIHKPCLIQADMIGKITFFLQRDYLCVDLFGELI